MTWLDPPECDAARQCLDEGNPVEAARVLLRSKYREHRAVRGLLLEIGRRLSESAERQFQAGHFEAAAQAVELAGQCAALDGSEVALQQKINEALRDQERRQAWQAERLAEAERLVSAGRLRSALDVLGTLDGRGPAEQLQAEVRRRLAQVERHVAECRECMAAGRPQAAYRHWQKARQLSPDDPQLAELGAEIADALSLSASGRVEARPVTDRSQAILLGNLALVVSAAEVCLGTPRGEGVHVPLFGPLHGRHAVLLRDRDGWQLAVCRDRYGKPCKVWLDGRPIDALCRLESGQRIDLGSTACRWLFRLPVPGSNTAVLEATEGSRGRVTTASGHSMSRVVLLDDELVIRAARPAHIVATDLPCKQLTVGWDQGRLRYAVEQGAVQVEFPRPVTDPESNQAYIPSCLVIEGRFEEAELLGRVAAGCQPAARLVLELADPCRSPGRSPRPL
ncbi:MAG: hypothetical protein ACUVQQ_01835 [Thermogutta sp.]